MTSDAAVEVAGFSIAYEGSRLDDHAMDVGDLAPALLAMNEAVERANALLNGGRASVNLQIKANQAGSFEIVLELSSWLIDAAADMLSGQTVTSAVALQALIFGGNSKVSALGLLKWLRGRPVPPPAGTDVSGNLVLSFDNLRLSVPPEVVRLLTDRSLRSQLESVVEPVLREGISRLVVKKDNQQVEKVEKAEAEALQPPLLPEAATPAETRMVLPRVFLRPDTVRFSDKGRWRLNDGQQTRSYLIEDTDFLREVASGQQAFAGKDSLICEVTIDQTLDAAGVIKTDYRITNVIEHIRHTPPPELI